MARDVKPELGDIQQVIHNAVMDYDLKSVDNPFVLFVTGVSGSGKSTLIEQLKDDINGLFIQADNYRKLHPQINKIIAKQGREDAHKKTGNYSNRFALALAEEGIKAKYNIIYEATFGNLETAQNLIKSFEDQDYQVFVIALPVNIEQSMRRNLQRYEQKKSDLYTLPRIVKREDIERMAINYQKNIQSLADQGIHIGWFDYADNIKLFVNQFLNNKL